MKEQIFTIKNQYGLDARPASRVVQLVSQFNSSFQISKVGESHVSDGTSIMKLMLLVAEVGSRIKVTVSGPDEEEAFRALGELIEAGFDEP